LAEVVETYEAVHVVIGLLHDASELLWGGSEPAFGHGVAEFGLADKFIGIPIELSIGFQQLLMRRSLYFPKSRTAYLKTSVKNS
jgi:hypothetical protein